MLLNVARGTLSCPGASMRPAATLMQCPNASLCICVLYIPTCCRRCPPSQRRGGSSEVCWCATGWHQRFVHSYLLSSLSPSQRRGGQARCVGAQRRSCAYAFCIFLLVVVVVPPIWRSARAPFPVVPWWCRWRSYSNSRRFTPRIFLLCIPTIQ